MDLPGTFDLLIEAQFVADGDGSKHSLLWKIYGITYHLGLNEKSEEGKAARVILLV